MPLGFPPKAQNGIKPHRATDGLLSPRPRYCFLRRVSTGLHLLERQLLVPVPLSSSAPSAGTWALSLPRPPELPREDGGFGGVRVPRARRQLVLPLSWQRGEGEDGAAHTPARAGRQLSQQLALLELCALWL